MVRILRAIFFDSMIGEMIVPKKSPVKTGLIIYNSNKNYTVFFFSFTTSAAAPNGLSFAKSTSIGAPTKIEE